MALGKKALDNIELASVSHKTLRELVYEELRKGFFSGKFAPGDSVTVAELSRELEVGAMPTREAVQQLASQGAFEFLPNRSVRVPVHDTNELKQLYEARVLNECYAAAQAATNCDAACAEHLRQLVQVLDDAVRNRTIQGTQVANADFHLSIYHLCNNRFVIDMIERLWLRVGPLHMAIWRDIDAAAAGIEAVLPQHWKLIDLLEQGDADAVEKQVKKLLELSQGWILRHTDVLQQPVPT